jgi:hypothetical protein
MRRFQFNANGFSDLTQVGHSLSVLTECIFAHDYPTEVAGVVLIDTISTRQMTALDSRVEGWIAVCDWHMKPQHAIKISYKLISQPEYQCQKLQYLVPFDKFPQ